MTEVVKGHANLSQLAIRWYYRAVAAHGVGKMYSRNVAQQQLSLPNFDQSASQVDMSPESIENGPPAFSGNTRQSDIEVA